METAVWSIAVLVVASAAGGVCWVLGRARLSHALVWERARFEAERATLDERIRGRDAEVLRLAGARADESARADRAVAQASALEVQLAAQEARGAEERRSAAEKLALLESAQEALTQRFKALSMDALQTNSQAFLDLARTALEKYQEGARVDLGARQQAIDGLVSPLREALEKVDGKLQELEKGRSQSQGALGEQLRSLAESQSSLREQTERLVGALKAPAVRGRWGEVQLRRVVELAGMKERCDFDEQVQVSTEGGRLRPDLVVRLPGNKLVVVDSKAPLGAYFEAQEAVDPERRKDRLLEHAAQVRRHVRTLAEKSYASHLPSAPEFVVMFIPGETFFAAAVETDPELIEFGASHNVILATPTTLIALLRAVAYGWRQDQVADNARHIQQLGQQLYDRLRTVAGHLTEVGKRLGGSVEAYNRAVGSLETRVMPSARKLKELGAGSEEGVPILEPVEHLVRQLEMPALAAAPRKSGQAA